EDAEDVLSELHGDAHPHVACSAGKACAQPDRVRARRCAGEVDRQPCAGEAVAEDRRFVRRIAAWAEVPYDVQPLPALFEEGARRLPHEVRHRPGVLEVERFAVAVHALELAEARDELRLEIDGSVARRTHEPGGGRTDTLDRFRAVRHLLHVNAGGEILWHAVLLDSRSAS